MIALLSSLTSPLLAGTNRGNLLIGEVGGVPGAAGLPGVAGTPGASGVFAFSDFFAIMPADNGAPIAAGVAVAFPQDGPTDGLITRTGPSTFLLPDAGTYVIEYQVSVTEAGQLMLRLAPGGEIASSVVGRATGTSQIVGVSLVTTVGATVLEVINPTGNPVALTITPSAGGPNPVSAHLSIIRIQ